MTRPRFARMVLVLLVAQALLLVLVAFATFESSRTADASIENSLTYLGKLVWCNGKDPGTAVRHPIVGVTETCGDTLP